MTKHFELTTESKRKENLAKNVPKICMKIGGDSMSCLTCNDERIIWVKDCYGRASAVNCSVCNTNGMFYKNKQRGGKMDILTIFWENVDWHLEHKMLNLSDVHKIAQEKRISISLEAVAEIAAELEIDDYAILFEELE